ncbi:unnamed protein product [Rodentolepis nana]|uniref:Arp2/3 complex 34 kDa subunit n=1 Tax=Rodentolepis nana TaxID=102285 RepID=A0A0R3TA33_RODNA|nr:unnamed protein product [Rodentolepis nana]
MSPLEDIRLDHPMCLFVTRDGEKNQFSFNLPFYPKHSLNLDISKPGRIFTVRQAGSEPFTDFETRMLQCLNKYFEKSLKASNESRSKHLKITKVVLANPQLNPDDRLETIFASPSPLRIMIGIEADIPRDLILDMVLNPASVKSVKLEMIPQVGCPITPSIVATNFDFKKSKFQWILSKASIVADRFFSDLLNTLERFPIPFATVFSPFDLNSGHRNKANSEKEAIWPSEEEEGGGIVHEGYIFTPQPEHLGHMVRLRVLPYDSEGRPGQPFGNPVPPSLSSENGPQVNIPRPLPFLGQLTTAPRPIDMAPAQKLIKKSSSSFKSGQLGTELISEIIQFIRVGNGDEWTQQFMYPFNQKPRVLSNCEPASTIQAFALTVFFLRMGAPSTRA